MGELGDLDALFYALLMKKRVELGVSPFPTGAAAELPSATHEEYEKAIREAGRLVGGEFLKQHNLRKAWFYWQARTGNPYSRTARYDPLLF